MYASMYVVDVCQVERVLGQNMISSTRMAKSKQ